MTNKIIHVEECGCLLRQVGSEREDVIIEHCAKHGAADELLLALRDIQAMVESTYCTPEAADNPIWQAATAAIAKAERKAA